MELFFFFCSSVVAAFDDVTACLGQFGQSTRCSGILSLSGTRLSQIKRTHHHWIKGQAHWYRSSHFCRYSNKAARQKHLLPPFGSNNGLYCWCI